MFTFSIYVYYLNEYTIDINCGALGDPANGEVSLSSTIFNSTATYSCNTGYTLTGDGTRTCLETGLWSGSEPMCTGKYISMVRCIWHYGQYFI